MLATLCHLSDCQHVVGLVCHAAYTLAATGILPGAEHVILKIKDLARHVLDLIPEAGIEVHRVVCG